MSPKHKDISARALMMAFGLPFVEARVLVDRVPDPVRLHAQVEAALAADVDPLDVVGLCRGDVERRLHHDLVEALPWVDSPTGRAVLAALGVVGYASDAATLVWDLACIARDLLRRPPS